ncbi:uncharacterized ATP-dependent helicase IRC20-like isoform X2 [Ischnura elegans]|nr:uncharacterized ATP-dependent helicase IRC20-like isoform X2 [Ischnura elegans]
MNFLDKRRICIKRALDSVPENIDLYNKLAKDLEEVENTYAIAHIMKEDKSDSERLHHLLETKRKILISDQCRQTKSIFELNKKQPFQYCPLENFIEKTPIEDVFWKTCSPDQINKLDEELIMLEGIYPLKPVTKLRRAMVYAYNYCKEDIIKMDSNKLRHIVKEVLIVKDLKNDEGVDCCSICLERYENGEVTRCLPCSHVFHSECIKEWKKNTCPVCRGSF